MRPVPDATPAARTARAAAALAPVAFFALALWALADSLKAYRYQDVAAALRGLPPAQVALALAIAACGYLVLAGYDVLAFRYVGRALRLRDFAATSFVANALGNSVGNILVTGAAVRYWMYASLGIPAADVARVVAFCSVGFWLGFCALGALWFLAAPISVPASLHLPATTTAPLGLALLVLLTAYVALVAMRRAPVNLGGWRFTLPSPALTLGQVGVASLDLCLMGSALYVLLPAVPALSFAGFMGVFLLALAVSTASQVPGGLGVFETVVLLLSPPAARPEIAAGLLAFRAVYFILPLFGAVLWLALRQAGGRAPRVRALLERPRRWIGPLVPHALAAAIFVSGTVLLLSGAVPAAAGRLARLSEFLPQPLIAVSHFAASVIGGALLLVAHAVQRRINVAYAVALGLLAAGSLLSLAKGWDYEEALLLAATLIALLPFQRLFYREASLLGERFTAAWIGSVAIVFAGSAWLGLFAFSHPEYSNAPWWGFALESEASRSLRAMVGAAGLAVLFGMAKLLAPARPRPVLPDAAALGRARPIIEQSVRTYANLAYRGDKALLFSRAGNAMLMYGRMRRSWIAMGDPVGPDDEARELLWQFRDECDRFGGWSVLFEVRPEHLHWYADLGLTLTKLGEEARVELASFDLSRPEFARLRQARSKLARSGCRFEILPREAVPAALPALLRVSDAWLARKATREKGFSNASFDERYLTHFPIAVVRRDGELAAFANLWQGAGKEELSVDLMRHLPDAPHGTMDVLFTELLLWGRGEGYRWFNFGMAPLSGLQAEPGAALWHRLGTLVYQHGEHFYNFRGLRAYKDKFHPAWASLYLASPGGVALPAILLDVTALMAGGYAGIFTRR